MDDWTELAARWGIEPSYFDIQGRRQEADEETLRRIVEALSAAGNPPAAVDGRRRQPRARLSGRRPRDAGCWRCSFTGCGRGATGATAISAISRRCWTSSPISAAPASGSTRCTRSSMTGPVLGQPVFAEQPAVSQSALHRRRGDRGIRPRSCRKSRAEIARLRDAELVDYPAVATLKTRGVARGVSEFCCERQRGSAARDFAAYRAERGRALECFAAFETLRQTAFRRVVGMAASSGGSPATTRCADCARAIPTKSAFTNSCNGTPSASSNAAATSRGGAECRSGSISTPRSASTPAAPMPGWTRTSCCADLSVGAPPDQFNPAGQDWGLTAYNPHGLVASDFEPFRQMLRAAMRHAGAVRIDHVLGLMRLYRHPARACRRARARICACRSPTCWRWSPRKAGAGIASSSARTSAPCRRISAPRCRPGACGPIWS